MEKKYIIFFEIPLYSSLIYFGELLSYKCLYQIFQADSSILVYFLPIITTVSFISPVYITYPISIPLYERVYFISVIVHAYLLNQFLCAILFKLISFFVQLSFCQGIFFLLILPLIVNIYGYIHANTLYINEIKLKCKGIKGKKKIAQISDLHLGVIYKTDLVKKVVQAVKKINPEVLVITGDLADGSVEFKDEWIQPFNELSMPILFITGNHEEIADKSLVLKAVEKTKIKYISTSKQPYECQGLNFIGIDYETEVREELKKIELDDSKPNILLYHVPEIYPKELEKYNIFLHLAGHTHGGQSIPIHFPTYLLNACFDGLYPNEKGDRYVYVTPGVGTALTPIRTYCRSEVAVITLEE